MNRYTFSSIKEINWLITRYFCKNLETQLNFWLNLYLTGVHFQGELQHVGDVSEPKIKCQPIRTREIGSV